jgi:aerobic-type carbon monoxide dehydrogenase small subunit (CoxS/CutS family)
VHATWKIPRKTRNDNSLGVDFLKITFVLNGKEILAEVPPDRRVIDFLREDLGLTGAKEGCGAGECGACTILVDGESRLSCLMLAAQLEGRSVTTIEGLARSENGNLHPVQEAFVQYGAVQCGFCTPGMALSAVQLLERNPNPDRDEIREGLSGNLCRCTGYVKIVDAVQAAARNMRESACRCAGKSTEDGGE